MHRGRTFAALAVFLIAAPLFGSPPLHFKKVARRLADEHPILKLADNLYLGPGQERCSEYFIKEGVGVAFLEDPGLPVLKGEGIRRNFELKHLTVYAFPSGNHPHPTAEYHYGTPSRGISKMVCATIRLSLADYQAAKSCLPKSSPLPVSER
jgi:hypothetical protein